jgi:DNA-binding FadR family transcriptional regulator
MMMRHENRGEAFVDGSEHIAKRKLSDEVFERLKRLIVQGEKTPGSLMPSERELMARFGVGRPVIREAMQQLASMGLVEINHGERARVLELTPYSLMRQVDQSARIMLSQSAESLEHLKSARIFFERGMVREAALKVTDEDLRSSASRWVKLRCLWPLTCAFIRKLRPFPRTQYSLLSAKPC